MQARLPARVAAWVRMLAVVACVLAVDQATKRLATGSIERGEEVNVFIGIDLVNVRNTGVAFGAFSDAGTAIAIVSAVALTGLLAWFALSPRRPGLWLAVGAVLGGALSNLADRALEGAVIDFIDPIAWPAFNLADVAIVLGVLGLLYVAEGDPEPREGSR